LEFFGKYDTQFNFENSLLIFNLSYNMMKFSSKNPIIESCFLKLKLSIIDQDCTKMQCYNELQKIYILKWGVCIENKMECLKYLILYCTWTIHINSTLLIYVIILDWKMDNEENIVVLMMKLGWSQKREF